jgi:PEP-CTERM motif
MQITLFLRKLALYRRPAARRDETMTRFATLTSVALSVVFLAQMNLPARAVQEIMLGALNVSGEAEAQAGFDTLDFGPLTDLGKTGARSAGVSGTGMGLVQAKVTQAVFASGSVTEDASDQVGNFVGAANVALTYSFEIVNPLVGVTPVTMFARAIGTASTTGQGSANGFFQVLQTATSTTSGGPGQPAMTVLLVPMCTGLGCTNPAPPSFNINQRITLMTNTDYLVILSVAAGAANEGQAPFSGSGTASIDPYFYLDPLIADPNDYTLLFSPGIVNSPSNFAVPEPSTWAMILLGFAGLGFAGYRRTRSPSRPRESRARSTGNGRLHGRPFHLANPLGLRGRL